MYHVINFSQCQNPRAIFVNPAGPIGPSPSSSSQSPPTRLGNMSTASQRRATASAGQHLIEIGQFVSNFRDFPTGKKPGFRRFGNADGHKLKFSARCYAWATPKDWPRKRSRHADIYVTLGARFRLLFDASIDGGYIEVSRFGNTARASRNGWKIGEKITGLFSAFIFGSE